jgi:hypothetical protein
VNIQSVYILSAARSGSTLLDMFLGNHPDALAVGEFDQLPKNLALNSVCSCGSPVRDCAFWIPIVDRFSHDIGVDLSINPYALDFGLFRSGIEIDRNRQTKMYLIRRFLTNGWVDFCDWFRFPLTVKFSLSGFDKSVQNIVNAHAVLREACKRAVIVDSSKSFRYSVSHYKLAPQSTRLILLTRDGRGVMASNLRSGQSRSQAVTSWERYYRRALPWIERNVAPSHVLRVRYEDLVSNTELELAKVLDFLKLPPEPIMRNVGRFPVHIVNGNHSSISKKSITNIRNDDRWRKELDEDDLAYFIRHGKSMSSKLGYEVRVDD